MTQEVVGQLPPGAKIINGQVVREIRYPGGRPAYRPVAFTLEQARALGADYYDPQLGWILGGRKTARENPLIPGVNMPGLAGARVTSQGLEYTNREGLDADAGAKAGEGEEE
ncbi:MAG TPA: hypothetical protein VNI83_02140 [Vicinamibacterales bacterium]|nr:hypothetical protein [Vicinamibacterales bacterium]